MDFLNFVPEVNPRQKNGFCSDMERKRDAIDDRRRYALAYDDT
jgi:hypothetical protein